jgi:hypothetical protein
MTSLADYNIPQSFDLCAAGSAAGALRLMGYAVNDEVLGKASVSYDLTPQMKLLKAFDGSHTFGVTVTDEKGVETVQNVVIVIDNGNNGPSIVWTGYDLSKRYSITDDLTVELVITASAGIKEFFVVIDSEVLTPTELRGVGLCDQLNLVTPENSIDSENPDNTDTSQVREALINLGFAVGDQILNQTKVNLSITQFLGLLKVTGTGSHDFILTVTDNDGNTTEKTLMLVTE